MINKLAYSWAALLIFLSIGVYGDEAHIETVSDPEARYNGKMRLYSDSAIFQGLLVKIDIGNMLVEMITSHGEVKSFEGAVALRLKRRFYPTVETGYARANAHSSGAESLSKGPFFKVGLDINGLRKHASSLNALLVGIRIGYSFQHYDATNVFFNDTYWQKIQTIDYAKLSRHDGWGEVVGGCNVHIYSGLMMGWYARFKILFTRSAYGKPVSPYYIPGFGYRDKTNWGFNYYIAYKF